MAELTASLSNGSYTQRRSLLSTSQILNVEEMKKGDMLNQIEEERQIMVRESLEVEPAACAYHGSLTMTPPLSPSLPLTRILAL
jgi:hypothetical protein